jgi:hypothetical protein
MNFQIISFYKQFVINIFSYKHLNLIIHFFFMGERKMKKRIVFSSLGIAILLLLLSLVPAVGQKTSNTSPIKVTSPLFNIRLQRTLTRTVDSIASSQYIGKDAPLHIPLPLRGILDKKILQQLEQMDLTTECGIEDKEIMQKWELVLDFVQTNLYEINQVMRSNQHEFSHMMQKLQHLSMDKLHVEFLDRLQEINLIDLQELTKNSETNTRNALNNLTTQPICNITYGPICDITSDESLLCITAFGPFCPTAGLKCLTAKPLCMLVETALKLIKQIINIVLFALVLFIPALVISLFLITVFNRERCEEIWYTITYRLNCSAT